MKVLHHTKEVEALDTVAVFVVHDDPDRVRAGILRELDVPWPVLIDLDRRAYRAWGLRRSNLAGVWLDPRVWGRYARLIAAGERPRLLGRDTLQLGGDFVVDPAGVITYARPQRRDDRPPVGILLTELRAAANAPR